MNLVFFTHPSFLGSQSMPRFAKMLTEEMKNRHHSVEVLTCEANFFNLPLPRAFKKWMGYIDQYLVFPSKVRKRIDAYPSNTLFVLTDHALGPWLRLVTNRPHVIHCHDFLAQLSAQKKIKANPTGFTGRLYQKFIWKGYSKGENFISVSKKTDEDLSQFLIHKPKVREVVYNGLNGSFKNLNPIEARDLLGKITAIDLSQSYILHIGGNQWYKNRIGVIEIYESWRSISAMKLPLLLIGKSPTSELNKKKEMSKYADDIFFLEGIKDEQLQIAYSGARLLLYPSLAEGFGWPIAEAMASGCPVVTTNEAPMTEVAADTAFLIRRKPEALKDIIDWADEAAQVVNQIVNLSSAELEDVVKAGIINSKRFKTDIALDKIEKIYDAILKSSLNL